MTEQTRTRLTLTNKSTTTNNNKLKQIKSKIKTKQSSNDIVVTGVNPLQNRPVRCKSSQLTTQQLQDHVVAPLPIKQLANNNNNEKQLNAPQQTTNQPQPPHASTIHNYINKFRYAPPTAPDERQHTNNNESTDNNNNKPSFWWQQIDIPQQYITSNNNQTPSTQQRKARINLNKLSDNVHQTPDQLQQHQSHSVPSTTSSIGESSMDTIDLINRDNNNNNNNKQHNLYNNTHSRILTDELNDVSANTSIDDIISQYSISPNRSQRGTHRHKPSYNIDIDSIIQKHSHTLHKHTKQQYDTTDSIDVDDLLSVWRKQQQYNNHSDINNELDQLTTRTTDTIDMLNSSPLNQVKANKLYDVLSTSDNIDVDDVVHRLRTTDVSNSDKPAEPTPQTIDKPIFKQSSTSKQASDGPYESSQPSSDKTTSLASKLTPLQQAANEPTITDTVTKPQRILSCAVDGVRLNVNNTSTNNDNDTASIKIHISSGSSDTASNSSKSDKHCCHCPPICDSVATQQHAKHHSCCPLHSDDHNDNMHQAITDSVADKSIEHQQTHNKQSIHPAQPETQQPQPIPSESNTNVLQQHEDMQAINTEPNSADLADVDADNVSDESVENITLATQQHTTNNDTHVLRSPLVQAQSITSEHTQFELLNTPHETDALQPVQNNKSQPHTTTYNTSIPSTTQFTMEDIFDQLMRHTLSNTASLDPNLLSNLLQFSAAANEQSKQHQTQKNTTTTTTTQPPLIEDVTTTDTHEQQLVSEVNAGYAADNETESKAAPIDKHVQHASKTTQSSTNKSFEPTLSNQHNNTPTSIPSDQITSMLHMILQSIQQLSQQQTQSRRHSVDYTDNTSHAVSNVDVHSITSSSTDNHTHSDVTPTATDGSLPHVQTDQVVSEPTPEPTTIVQEASIHSEPVLHESDDVIEPLVTPAVQQTQSITSQQQISAIQQQQQQQLHTQPYIYVPTQPYIQPQFMPSIYSYLHHPYMLQPTTYPMMPQQIYPTMPVPMQYPSTHVPHPTQPPPAAAQTYANVNVPATTQLNTKITSNNSTTNYS